MDVSTNSMSYLTEAARLAGAFVTQMETWPSAVLLGFCLLILGAVIKMLAFISNRYIPAIVLVTGTLVNLLIGDTGRVDHTQRNPEVILAMWGFCVAFGSWMAHIFVLKRFEKYLPMFNGRSGHTDLIEKPKETK